MLNISWLCEIALVSRSGYYNWLRSEERRKKREEQDQHDFDLILEAYTHRGYDKGSRGIHMRLLHIEILMNRKKIQRLMRKFGLFCPIRKPNPYKRMAKARKEHALKPNLVNREFRAYGPRTILLTDITYLFYGRGRKAYLSVVIDAFTNQVLAYQLSESLSVDFVLEMIEDLLINHEISRQQKTLIHSDQGIHYTSMKFQTLFVDKALRQSMSRRGNCWDNAPQESFFGHMKDEIAYLGDVETFSDLHPIIDDYMDYHNTERYQWKLAKLSPNQYYDYFKTGVYPLSHLVKTPDFPEIQVPIEHLN